MFQGVASRYLWTVTTLIIYTFLEAGKHFNAAEESHIRLGITNFQGTAPSHSFLINSDLQLQKATLHSSFGFYPKGQMAKDDRNISLMHLYVVGFLNKIKSSQKYFKLL